MSMAFWNRNPLIEEFTRARNDMDRMLGRFVGASTGSGEFGTMRPEGWVPAVDVSESEDEVVVRGEIPGISPRDLEITVAGTTLNISGKKEEKEECDGEDFYRCERRFGSFRRVIELPESIDPDKVVADADNGVVTIRIAKKPGQRTRRVEIKPAARRIAVPS
ncbi:MAG: Hsp20/alpha crystallin family protein [Planctomycetaceae bacterium]|nr:Hsp20/alpha crystallin family protein [Planctomycetaceae bacterium]